MRTTSLSVTVITLAILVIGASATLSDGAAEAWVNHNVASLGHPAGQMTIAQATTGTPDEKELKPQPSEEKREFRVRPGQVTIYTTPTCPWCHKAKAWFRDKRIRYKEVDVTTDRAGLEEMMRISGQSGVPVIVIGDEVIVGFNQNRLNEIFKD